VDAVEYQDGDAELGQRKSKLIAIYDIHLKLDWSSTGPGGAEAKGTLDIPEISHEITLDKLHSYTYNWSLATERTPDIEKLFQFAQARLPHALEAKFSEFPAALMATHGKDITVSAPNSKEPSRTSTPVHSSTNPISASSKITATEKAREEKALNTTNLFIDAGFMASAEDLFALLTDEKKIPQWSRNPAISNPVPGSSYSIFGGNIKGSYSIVSPPTKFVQSWALQHPSWPQGHYATLTTHLEQLSESTKITWSMIGIPVGLEDEIHRNIQGYYVGGLKSIGLGSML